MFARPFIDSIDFAKNGGEMCGEIPLDQLPRLKDVLARTVGGLAYKLSGSCANDQYMLMLTLQGECRLSCQRCLGELVYPVNTVSHFRLLPAERLDEVNETDGVDAIEAVQQLDVLALIEDEVLLGLPFAPRHEEGICSPAINGLQQSVNPFAVLAGLKKKQ